MEANKEKHFELTEEFKVNIFGIKLFRIKCTRKVKEIEVGTIGGWVSGYANVSGNAWVSGNAEVYGDAEVSGYANVSGDAEVYGYANVSGNAEVYGDAEVSGYANVSGDAEVSGYAKVSGNAEVYGDAEVSGYANVSGDAEVSGYAKVSGNAEVYGNAWVSGNAEVSGDAKVYGDADYCSFQSFGSAGRTTTVFKEKENKLKVRCGCFYGTIEEFEKQVESTHGDNKHSREYKAIINVIKVKFDLWEN